MSSGSGNRYMMMYLMQQQQQQAEAQERMWNSYQEQQQQQVAREETQRQDQIGQSGQRVSSSYDAALSDAMRRISNAGLDPNSGYGAQILQGVRSQYDTARASAPEIVADASGLFRNTAYDDIYNELLGTQRSGFNRQLNEFAGTGFQNNLISGSADDQYIDSIIGNQYTDAEATLRRALDRGQINDVGFNRAMGDLGLARNAAVSQGNSIGDSVLQGYRDELIDLVGGFRDQINQYDLTGSLDPNAWRNTIDTRSQELLGKLQGDVTNKIGDMNFFDVDTLLGKAGVNSGVMNNNTQMRPQTGIGGTSNNLPGIGNVYETEQERQQLSEGIF